MGYKSRYESYMEARGEDYIPGFNKFLAEKYNITEQSKKYMSTPYKVALEMVDLVPKEFWSNPKSRVLDFWAKSGIFTSVCFDKFMDGLKEFRPDEIKRADYIAYNCLVGVYADGYSKAYVHERFKIPNSYQVSLDGYESVQYIKDTIQKEFEGMKFDLVIGNPPYNRGMDLDFIKLGYAISNKYTIMITPAKWQTTPDDYKGCVSKTIDYKEFRRMIVPHMSQVVFYPDALDVFEAAQNDGITYFILDKNTHNNCIIENKCVRQKYFNSTSNRSLLHRETLHNIGNEIVEYLGEYNRYNFKNKGISKKYYVSTTTLLSNSLGQGGSYDWDNGGHTKRFRW